MGTGWGNAWAYHSYIHRALSLGLDLLKVKNVSCAALRASSTSASVLTGADAHGLPVPGSMMSKRSPDWDSTHLPPMCDCWCRSDGSLSC